jgi:hypothetical protein
MATTRELQMVEMMVMPREYYLQMEPLSDYWKVQQKERETAEQMGSDLL